MEPALTFDHVTLRGATAQQATYDSECASALSQLVAATSNVPAACR